MKRGRDSIIKEIATLEEAVRSSGRIDIANILRVARRAAIEEEPLSALMTSDAYRARDIDWFDYAIDQLTRLAYENELAEVEHHLVCAREAWDARRSKLSVNADKGAATPH